jgi:NADPH:quinone reductase-like Zn-dependent oxidoreductase
VVIYTEQDFRKLDERFDIVFDAVGKTSKKDAKRILTAGGQYQSVGGLDIAKETVEQVELLKQLFETQRLHANIDRVYPLDEIVAAHAYVDTERKKGNVVVRTGGEK